MEPSVVFVFIVFFTSYVAFSMTIPLAPEVRPTIIVKTNRNQFKTNLDELFLKSDVRFDLWV